MPDPNPPERDPDPYITMLDGNPTAFSTPRGPTRCMESRADGLLANSNPTNPAYRMEGADKHRRNHTWWVTHEALSCPRSIDNAMKEIYITMPNML